jgi:hypothetical protein
MTSLSWPIRYQREFRDAEVDSWGLEVPLAIE